MLLTEYYKQPHFERALNSFVAAKPDWPLRARYELHRRANLAFDGRADESVRRDAVGEMYRLLIDYWDILRPHSREECWDADRVFEALSHECEAVSRTGGVDLVTFDAARHGETLLASVGCFNGIKPTTGDFPHMTSSKLLHFFNPTLFPIYDRAEIWNNVCRGAFKRDYDEFCRKHDFKVSEPSVKFNLYYTQWAAEIMQSADSAIGQTFAEWFRRQIGVGVDDPVIQECHGYWGAMFEIAAIGAAHLER